MTKLNLTKLPLYIVLTGVTILAGSAYAEEKIHFDSRQYIGFDAEKGAVCRFDDVQAKVRDDGTMDFNFYLDTGSALEKNRNAKWVDDERTLKAHLYGKPEESENPDELIVRVKNHDGHIFHYDWVLTLDKKTKELRAYESFSTYVGGFKKDHGPVIETSCKGIVGAKTLGKSYFSTVKAAQALYPSPLDMPSCGAISKYFHIAKTTANEDRFSMGAVAIALGLAFPPAAGVAIPLGMATIGGNALYNSVSGNNEFMDKNADTAQALHQAYLYSKSSAAVFNFPMVLELADYKGGGIDDKVFEKVEKVVKILNEGSQSKELCSIRDPKTNLVVYAPRSFAELKAYVDQKLNDPTPPVKVDFTDEKNYIAVADGVASLEKAAGREESGMHTVLTDRVEAKKPVNAETPADASPQTAAPAL